MEIYKHFINGEWVESRSGLFEDNINPATGEVIGKVSLASRQETQDTIKAAHEAYSSWKSVPAPERARFLFKAVRLMEERKPEIARTLTQEEGKTYRESLGEVQKTINQLEFMAGEGRRLSGLTRPSELPNTFCYTVRQPLGVVGLITAWNFPVAIPAWKIAPALVAGNTVVLKPSPLTPGVSVHLARILEDTGLPRGVFNLLHGTGAEVGDELGKNELIRAISFTGGDVAGLSLNQAGAARGIRVQCEMGGKNPLIVLADADLELAVEAAFQGAFGSTGQRCTATSRVVIEASVADRFVEMLTQRMDQAVMGNGFDEAATIGPCVDASRLDAVLEYIRIGLEEDGAVLVKGGQRLRDGALAKGYFVAPALFDQVTPSMRIAQEEVFGPVLAVLRVSSFEEAIAVANGVRYGLSSSIYTQNSSRLFQYVDRIDTGILHVNSPTIGGEAHLPFGGMKATGLGGREMNEEALDFFTELKAVYVDYTGTIRKSNIY